MNLLDFDLPDHKKPKLKCVVRITTSTYTTNRGVVSQRTMNCLKRKSDLSIDDFCGYIVESLPLNFYEVSDGLYELSAINISKDWETGIIDDWDVILVEYKE